MKAIKNVSRCRQMSLGVEDPPLPPVENHCATPSLPSPLCPPQLQTEARQGWRPFDNRFTWPWQEGRVCGRPRLHNVKWRDSMPAAD